MYQFYKRKDKCYAVYVEGIGTAPRDDMDFIKNCSYADNRYSDSTMGSAVGVGVYGVNAKVERGCDMVIRKIKTAVKDEENYTLQLSVDVFGFSRGAAAARRFTSCLKEKKGDLLTSSKFSKVASTIVDKLTSEKTKSKAPEKIKGYLDKATELRKEEEEKFKVCLQDWLDENEIKLDGDVEVTFLGLYDTVSSYGFAFDDDVKELALDISSQVKSTFQICAADEYRRNFSLTLIESASNGNFIILPGAHSDIGGGYTNNMKENFILSEEIVCTTPYPMGTYYFAGVPAYQKVTHYAGNKSRDLLLDEGWFTLEDEKIGYRIIGNRYSVIPLRIMMKKKGLSNFNAYKETDLKKGDDESIANAYKLFVDNEKKLFAFEGGKGKKEIVRHINLSKEEKNKLKRLYNKFLHLSVKSTFLEASKDCLVHGPQTSNIRKIIEDK